MSRKRELIEPHPGDKRYARRSSEGQFTTDQADVGRSLTADRKKHAKKIVPKGQGDKGDQKVAALGRRSDSNTTRHPTSEIHGAVRRNEDCYL